MKEYIIVPSRYISTKHKCLNNYTIQNSFKDKYYLFVFIKKGRKQGKKKVKFAYAAQSIPYYTIHGLYEEANHRLNTYNLQMEIKLEVPQTFSLSRENFFILYSMA